MSFQTDIIVAMDMDGTTHNTMPSYTRCFSNILKKHGVPTKGSSAYYNQQRGKPLGDQFREIFESNGVAADAYDIGQMKDDFWNRAGLVKAPLFDDVIPGIEKMKADKQIAYHLFIVSSTKQEILEKRITNTKFRDYLDGWVGEKNGSGKKEFLKQEKRFADEHRMEMYFVGDGVPDMRLAKEFGIVGIGIIRDRYVAESQMRENGARHVIRSFVELPTILKSNQVKRS